MTTSGTFKITIKAAPEIVWPWISQLDKHPQWSPKPYRVEFVSGVPNAVGARYKSVGWVPILFPLVGKADIRKRMGMLKTRAEASR